MKVISKYVVILVLCYMTFSYLGCKKDTIHIDYRRPSMGDTVTLTGTAGIERGDSAANSVFLDLSKEVQTPVARRSWDLGFYNAKDTFKVIINPSAGATVMAVNKSMTEVTRADSVANGPAMVLSETSGNATTVDPVTGDAKSYINGVIIGLNQVYILNRGNTKQGQPNAGQFYTADTFRPGIKLRITQITNGYHIEYGNLDDQQFSQLDILKDVSFNFKYISLSSLNVNVEPAKPLWDIEWGRTTYKNASTPIVQSDFVMINYMGSVRAAEVIAPSGDGLTAYKNFQIADLAGITYSAQRDVIGVNWFDVAGSSSGSVSVRKDRFYVIKDPQGNVYKLNFFGGGGRGRPIIQYKNLVDGEPKDPGTL